MSCAFQDECDNNEKLIFLLEQLNKKLTQKIFKKLEKNGIILYIYDNGKIKIYFNEICDTDTLMEFIKNYNLKFLIINYKNKKYNFNFETEKEVFIKKIKILLNDHEFEKISISN